MIWKILNIVLCTNFYLRYCSLGMYNIPNHEVFQVLVINVKNDGDVGEKNTCQSTVLYGYKLRKKKKMNL